MAVISVLSRVLTGVVRNVDLSTNTLAVGDITVGGLAGTNLTKTILDSIIALRTDLSATSGSGLIGDTSTYTNFTPAAATVKGALSGIDSALASISVTPDFSDSVFRIHDNGDATKKLAFEVSTITTATTRTITVPDANVDLGNLTNSNISASAAIALTKLAALGSHNRLLVSDNSGFITESAVTSTEAGYLSGVTSAIQTQINNISSSIQNFEWQPSVLSATLLTPPGSPTTGDRYLINGTGAGGWAGHNNVIAQWSGSAWVYTVPTTGTFVASDAEPNLLYLFGGSTWSSKAFEATTASTGLTKVGFDIQLANATGTGITVTGGVLAVLFDNSTIGLTGNTLFVKNAGITATQLAASSVTENAIAATALLSTGGLSGGGGTKLSVNTDGVSTELNTNQIRIKTTAYDGTTISGGGGAAASVLKAPALGTTEVAGESLSAATLYALRWAKAADSGFVAGRMYKADPNAASVDNFYVAGLALTTGAVTAGQNVSLVSEGIMNVPSHGLTIGQPFYLTSAGLVTSTVPTTTQFAIVKLGMVKDSSNLFIQIQTMGVLS